MHQMLDLNPAQWRWRAAYADRHCGGWFHAAITYIVADAMALDGDHETAALALIDAQPPQEVRDV